MAGTYQPKTAQHARADRMAEMRTAAPVALIVQATLALVVACLPWLGLSVQWAGAVDIAAFCLCLVGVWAYFAFTKSAPWEQRIGEGALAWALLLALGLWAGPAQYAAMALGRPYIDGALMASDALLGVSVKTTAAWLALHPSLSWWLAVAYASLLWQFLLIVPALVFLKQSAALWEYVTVFHLSSLVTVLCLALWPAEGAFVAMGFTSGLDQTGYLAHLAGVRQHTLGPLEYGHLVGMVSLPSFHLAGAWMVTWALRRTWLVWPVAVLNVALAGGTILTGAHYLTDGIGSAVMLAGCYPLARFFRTGTPRRRLELRGGSFTPRGLESPS